MSNYKNLHIQHHNIQVEIVNDFLYRSGNMNDHSQNLVLIYYQKFNQCNKARKRNRHKDWKGRKLTFVTENTIVYVENPKELKVISEFKQGHKTQDQYTKINSVSIYYQKLEVYPTRLQDLHLLTTPYGTGKIHKRKKI